MIDTELESLCRSIRLNLGNGSIPIDPERIARKEGIILAPGDYGPGFDGRIEFLLPERKFVIYYQEKYTRVSMVRIRFSLAHELGHYYLEKHREALCRGEAHDSEQGLYSEKKREREADAFAASLLIPQQNLNMHMGQKGFMDMAQIMEMADELKVSIPAASIRYCGYAEENCAIILSKAGQIKCHLASDGMKEIGLGFLKAGTPVPSNSKAKKLLDTPSYRKVESMETSTDEWYQHRRYTTLPLYEDSLWLGYDESVLTLLSVWKVD